MINETWVELEYPEMGEVEEVVHLNLGLNVTIFVLTMAGLIVSLLADIFTLYIVSHFTRLKKQHQNIYIFHASMLNILNFTLSVIIAIAEIYRKMHVVNSSWWYFRWLHTLMDMILSFTCTQFFLMNIMAIDWYIFWFSPNRSVIFRKHSTPVIVGAYSFLFTIMLYSFAISLQYGFTGYLTFYLLLGNIVFSFMLYIILGVSYLCRRKRLIRCNAVALKISFLKVTLWVLLIIFVALYLTVSPKNINVLYFTMLFILLLILLLPVLQLTFLYIWDRNYAAVLSRILDCRTDHGEVVESLEVSVNAGVMIYTANNEEVTHRNG